MNPTEKFKHNLPKFADIYSDNKLFFEDVKKLAENNAPLMVNKEGKIVNATLKRFIFENLKGLFGKVNHTNTGLVEERVIQLLEYGKDLFSCNHQNENSVTTEDIWSIASKVGLFKERPKSVKSHVKLNMLINEISKKLLKKDQETEDNAHEEVSENSSSKWIVTPVNRTTPRSKALQAKVNRETDFNDVAMGSDVEENPETAINEEGIDVNQESLGRNELFDFIPHAALKQGWNNFRPKSSVVSTDDEPQSASEEKDYETINKIVVERIATVADTPFLFKQGWINNSNIYGRTPLHLAVEQGDYEVFADLIASGALASINVPDNQGNTPLHVACAQKNIVMVRLLLDCGAGVSLNEPNSSKITPFGMALKTLDVPFIESLMKVQNFNAVEEIRNLPDKEKVLKEAVLQDNSSFLKYFIEKGEGIEFLSLFVTKTETVLHFAAKSKSEAILAYLTDRHAPLFTTVQDERRLTPMQVAIVDGDVELVKNILESFPDYGLKLNHPDSYQVSDMQRAIRSGNIEMKSLLQKYLIDEQIRANEEASVPDSEAEACQTLSEIEHLAAVSIEDFAFPLTILQNNCNAMIRLSDGNILRVRNTDAKKARDIIMERKYGSEWVSDKGANVLTMYLSPGHGFLRLECRNCNNGRPYNMDRGFYPTGRRLGAEVPNLIFNIEQPTEFSDQIGNIQREEWYENDSLTKNSLKIMMYVDDKAAQSALGQIKDVEYSCVGNPENACRYNFLKRNCVDFVQEVFEKAGGAGDFVDYFTEEQLGYLPLPHRIWEFKAVGYGFIRSRGVIKYLVGAAPAKIVNTVQWLGSTFGLAERNVPASNTFVHIKQLRLQAPTQPKQETPRNESQEEPKSTTTSADSQEFPLQLPDPIDTVRVAVTIGYIAKNALGYLSHLYTLTVGEKAEPTEVFKFLSKVKFRLDDLEELEDWLNFELGESYQKIEDIEAIEESEVSLNQLEEAQKHLKAMTALSDRQIDLYAEGLEIKIQLKRLKKSKVTPTKKFISQLEQRVKNLKQNTNKLINEFSSEKLYRDTSSRVLYLINPEITKVKRLNLPR